MSTSIIVTGANGRMGSTIAGLAAKDRDLNLVGVVERPGSERGLESFRAPVFTDLQKAMADSPGAVVVDFTSPEAGMDLVRSCQEHSCAAVLGTTGFSSEQTAEMEKLAETAPIFWAPNMSVGINTLLQILPRLAGLLGQKYDMEISEIHHRYKKDAPSGTALKLGQVLAEARDLSLEEHGKYCRKGMIGERSEEEIGVQTLRGGDVVGDHTVYFFGPGERIEVTHRAHSRETFAQGALRAAAWISGRKPGRLYGMADLLS
ncbi:MAG: 4-hydroxy-tetrahydrodipicolinate reductase [Desulfonatronovibrionaceae bacterium]